MCIYCARHGTSWQSNQHYMPRCLANTGTSTTIPSKLYAVLWCADTAHYLENECMRQAMEDVLYRAGVNIIFNGHLHVYERTYPMYVSLPSTHYFLPPTKQTSKDKAALPFIDIWAVSLEVHFSSLTCGQSALRCPHVKMKCTSEPFPFFDMWAVGLEEQHSASAFGSSLTRHAEMALHCMC